MYGHLNKLQNFEKVCNQFFLKKENCFIYKTNYVQGKLKIKRASFFK